MFRPSIVICNNIFTIFKYKLWHFLSKFSKKYKTFKTINSYITKISENSWNSNFDIFCFFSDYESVYGENYHSRRKCSLYK